MLNKLMEIVIKARIRTKVFDGIRNKANLPEILLLEFAHMFGLRKPIAKQQIKITIKEGIE